MILYHGSNVKIDRIDLGRSKPNKDFGKGFYLSNDKSQAHEMAVFKSMLLGGDPVVTSFEFNENILSSESPLKIKLFNGYTEEWADFVLSNREGYNIGCYDIVFGPIADDKIGLQIRKLRDGSIDKTEFLNRLKYMKGTTYQYFFGTEAAIKYLKRI